MSQMDASQNTRKLHGLRKSIPFSAAEYYLNYEQQWLEFNWRVLREASEPDRWPLVDRLRFLSITASNLDEFFQKRVGALKRQQLAETHLESVDGLLPQQQILLVRDESIKMASEMDELFINELVPDLAGAGFHIRSFDELDESQRKIARAFFAELLFPILTPLAVDPGHPFPFISNLTMSLCYELRDMNNEWKFVRVKIPANAPRFVAVSPANAKLQVYVPVEQIVMAYAAELFPGLTIERQAAIRLTRDVEGDRIQESADDLLDQISDELRSRKYAPVVRLQVSGQLSEQGNQLLREELDIVEHDLYPKEGLLGIVDVMQLTELPLDAQYSASRWTPKRHPRLHITPEVSTSFFDTIKAGELLVHYPYYAFESSYMEFLREACTDPNVLAIKMTLYRSSPDWEGFDYLKEAAEAGKQVVVLVELQARFDEARNIHIANMLERSGVHVAYGVVGLKTHSKFTLVVRQEAKRLRKYVHVGTGNYNPNTARVYEDLGIYTLDANAGDDAVQIFNFLTSGGPGANYNELWVAPKGIRPQLREAIEHETEIAKAGGDAWIRCKMNALEDPRIIQLFYAASCAGVQIDLIVRGVCRLRPGLKGVSENIRVRSIIGRFLEHSRIYSFGNGGEPRYFIGSADTMRRNLDRRVEVLAPVKRKPNQNYLAKYFEALIADTAQAWELAEDGHWTPVRETATKKVSVHDTYMKLANRSS